MKSNINSISIGDKESFQKTITETDVYMFSGISGDLNPIHINEEYAKESFFKTRIVHGTLSGSLISTVIGMKLPGPGTIYLSQEYKFTKPVYIGDTIKAIVEVVEKDELKNIIKLKTMCYNQSNQIVINGTAVVRPPK